MATADQIRNWIQSNPQATQADIQTAMSANKVSPAEVAAAIGNTVVPQMPVEVKQQQYVNIVTQGVADPFFNNMNRATTAAKLGLGVNELQAVEPNAQQVAGTVYRADQIQKGAVTPEQIRAYLAGNPNISENDLYLKMKEFGVTPAQLASATGYSSSEVEKKYNEASAEMQPTGLAGYKQEITQGLTDAMKTLQSTLGDISKLYGINVQDLQAASDQARKDITGGYTQAQGYLSPYQLGGEKAYQQQLALSGALGQEAFNAARQQSPYEQFLFDQGMRANLAGAAATGGLGGGNVQKELQRFGQGLATQGLQQQISNLNTLSGMGQNAATNMGNLSTGLGTALGNLGVNTAQNIAAQRGQEAGYMSGTGTNIANLQYGTAQGIANEAMNVGNQLATQRQAAAQLQANLLESQGINMSNLIGTQGQNVINLGQGAYDQYIQDVMNQGTTQAEILGGQGFAQAPPPNYRGMAADALNAAGTGYYLGQRMQTPTQNPQAPYFSGSNPSPSYGRERPGQSFGQASTGIPGMRPINYLTGRVSP
jgi:hypothetical protein